MRSFVFLVVSVFVIETSRAYLFRVPPPRPSNELKPEGEPCAEAPRIEGAKIQSAKRRFNGDNGLIFVHRATYSCLNGQAPVGNPIATCRAGTGDANDGVWTAIPRCPVAPMMSDWSSQDVGTFRNSIFDNTDRISYFESPERGNFQAPVQQVENQPKPGPKMLRTGASNSEAPTYSGAMFGGNQGAQCIKNAKLPHTSCLEDSKACKGTEAFPIEEVLSEHNRIRKMFVADAKEMPMLKWDDELAKTAERWAAQCPSWHDDPSSRKDDRWFYVGQNICWSSVNKMSWKECVNAWYSEIKDWKYGKGLITPGAEVGHFTQLVWAKTEYVGCGRAQCNGEWDFVLVCNYGQGGNVAFEGGNPFAWPYEKKL